MQGTETKAIDLEVAYRHADLSINFCVPDLWYAGNWRKKSHRQPFDSQTRPFQGVCDNQICSKSILAGQNLTDVGSETVKLLLLMCLCLPLHAEIPGDY